MRLALFQPDIPQNTGTILRMAACLNVGVDIIEPCGFLLDDARFKRATMDYIHLVDLARHTSWEKFMDQKQGRLVLLTTKGSTAYTDFAFQADDILVLGQESVGAPDFVHEAAQARILVKMAPKARSLNIAMAAAMVTGEALRQVNGFFAG